MPHFPFFQEMNIPVAKLQCTKLDVKICDKSLGVISLKYYCLTFHMYPPE